MVAQGDELTFVLPKNDNVIGNLTLPALHGGAVAGFMEQAAIIFILLQMGSPGFPKLSISPSITCAPGIFVILTRVPHHPAGAAYRQCPYQCLAKEPPGADYHCPRPFPVVRRRLNRVSPSHCGGSG